MIFQESFLHKSSKYLIVVAAMAVVLAMNLPLANAWVKNQFYSLTEPLQKYAWSVSSNVSAVLGNISGMSGAVQENNRLKGRIIGLESQVAELNDLKKENHTLHGLLDLGLDKEYDLKMAQVTAKDMAQDSLLVDKGSNDSITNGAAVIDSNKAVVGRVVAVYDKFSKVELLTDKASSFDVRVGDGGIDGLARGQGNFNLSLDLIPKDKDISSGLTVVTSPLGGIFPKDLVVGNIGLVHKNDAQMFQKAQIIPAFMIEDTDQVFIVMGVNAPADVPQPTKDSPAK
jgi:rod shape-determining protein MreC